MKFGALVTLIWVMASGPAVAFLWYPFSADEGRSRSFSGGHTAIDFTSSCGTDVFAAADGVVSQAVDSSGCRRCYDCYQGCANQYVGGPCANNQVYIDHPNGYQTRYLHLEMGSVVVARGQQVRAGQRIGRSSNVGWTCGATGCHLHFEVKNPQGSSVNPDGLWLEPRRYGGDVGDGEAPVCSFTDGPAAGIVLQDDGEVRWRAQDAGGSHLRGATDGWAPVAEGAQIRHPGADQDRLEGGMLLSSAGLGRHTAHVRAWDGEGNTCEASAGPYWYFPVPFVRAFLIAGPLATEGGARDRLDEAPLGAEAGLLPRPGDAASDQTWRAIRSEAPYVDLDALLGGDERLAYAVTYCRNTGPPAQVDVHLGSDDGCRLWVNGEPIGEHREPRGAEPDQDRHRIGLPEGYSVFVLAVEEKSGAWGFFLRIARPDAPDEAAGIDCYSDWIGVPCSSDPECLGDAVCESGACQAPGEPPTPDAGPPPIPDGGGAPPAHDASGGPRGDADRGDSGGGGADGSASAPGADGAIDQVNLVPAPSDERPTGTRLEGGCTTGPIHPGGPRLAAALLLLLLGLGRWIFPLGKHAQWCEW